MISVWRQWQQRTFELERGGRLFNVGHAGLPGMENVDLPATLADGQTAPAPSVFGNRSGAH